MGRRCIDGDFVMEQFQPEAECDRQHAKDGRDRRQHHRTGAFAAGLQHGIALGPAFAAQAVIGVDQDDVVVHHHAGQGDDAKARHDDAERLAGDQQAKEHANCRHDHGHEDQEDAGELVELCQQDDEDQEDSRPEGAAQEGACLVTLFARSGQPPTRTAKIQLRQCLSHLRLDRGCLEAARNVGRDHDCAFAIDTIEGSHARLRFA